MEKKLQFASYSLRRHTKTAARHEKIRFGFVGIINTAVDFIVLNILVILFAVPLIPANIASTTVAMLTSFGLNKRVVFKGSDGDTIKQLVLFFAVTLSAIWIVQSGCMYLAYNALHTYTGWSETILLNVAKLVGISASLVWNYVWYSRVVFRDGSRDKK